MSMTLILWKGPVVRTGKEAEALLKPFYETEDDSGFEPSPDVAAVADELRRLYPYRELSNEETVAAMPEEERRRYSDDALKELRGIAGGEPWANLPFHQTDRLLLLDIRWDAGDAVIGDITRLARQHQLVLYDPQGPDVHLPDDPAESEPMPAMTVQEWFKGFAISAVLVGLTYAALQIPVGWIKWPSVVILGFLAIASLFAVGCMIAGGLGLIDPDGDPQSCA